MYGKENILKEVLEKFAEESRRVLQLEIDQEIQNAENILENSNIDELEEKGQVIQHLEFYQCSLTCYGEHEIVFKRSKFFIKLIFLGSTVRQQNVFYSGDVIEFFYLKNYSASTKPVSERGHIKYINEYEISIIFKEEIECKSGTLVKLYDCTFKQIFDMLLKLETFDLKEHNIELLETIFKCNSNSETSYHNENIIDQDSKINFINQDLNDEQRFCVESSMKTKNLFIIHGPPGTGKTSTLVEIILQNLERGKNILVVSPSNIAIDTIAERLLKYIDADSNQVCRIGHPTRLLEEVKRISVEEKLGENPDIKDIIIKINKCEKKSEKKELLNSLKPIRKSVTFDIFEKCSVYMATTVSSASKDLQDYLEKKETYFDLVIIDECAQAKESECFIPILQGRK